VWEPAVSSSAPANRAELRDRIRRAVCEAEGFAWDSDLLEPDEYGEVADAVLAVLPAPADRTLLETAPSEPQPDTEFAYLFWECEEPDGCEHGEGEACPSVRVHRDDYDGLIDFLSDDRRIRADLGTAVKALAAANARIAELEAAVPSRFDATPLQVEEHLKRVLAEDVRLRHQQAIGGRAVTEAAKEVRAEAADELHPAIRGAYTRTADFIDPLKGGGPYPSALVEFPVRPAVDGVQR
jgi:hypothetical protein